MFYKKEPAYTPTPVWKWKQKDKNAFVNINHPVAGATFDAELPVG